MGKGLMTKFEKGREVKTDSNAEEQSFTKPKGRVGFT